MFNESLKKLFIEEVSDSNDVILMFSKSQPYEERYGKDLCGFTQEQLQDFANRELGILGSTRQLRFSVLKKYIDWCAQKKVPGVCIVASDLDPKDYTRMTESMVASPAHLGAILDVVFRSVEQHTVDNVYRSFLWMAFSGVLLEDVAKVKTSDVDFHRMEFRFCHQKAPIYREAVPALTECVDQIQFLKEVSNGSSQCGYIWCDRANGNALLRGFSDEVLADSISHMIRRSVKAAKKSPLANGMLIPNLNYSHIYISGQFFRVREREMMGIPINFRDILTNECLLNGTYNQSDQKFMKNLAVRTYRRKMDYECWKAAFSK